MNDKNRNGKVEHVKSNVELENAFPAENACECCKL